MVKAYWIRHALAIGVFEFRRSARALWRDKARLGLMAFVIAILLLVATSIIILFADAIRSVGVLPVPDQLRTTLALFWLFEVFIVGQRVISARTHIEAEPLLLTTVSARAVAGGLFIAETLRNLAYLGLYAVVLTGVAIFLLGSWLSLVFIPVSTVLFTATAVVVGMVCGYAVAWLTATSPLIMRHKTVLGVIGAIIIMSVYALFLYPQLSIVSQASLAWLPMGWFADLAAIGTPFAGSSVQAYGALFGSVVLLLVSSAIIEREAVALWFVDPVSTDEGTKTSQPIHHSALTAAVKPIMVPRIVSIPTRRVAEWSLLRTRRDPNRLTFILVPVFAIGSLLVSSGLQSMSLSAVIAPACAVVLSWLAGALFALNPLGDEGRVLPVTLTTVSGRQYTRGLMIPGLLIGIPAVLTITAIVSVLSPYTLIKQSYIIVLCVFLTSISVAIAPAIGMRFPRFSAISVGQSQDVRPPRMSAVIIHFAAVVVPGVFLVLLVLSPRFARYLLSTLFGFLPAFLLTIPAESSGGVLSAAAGLFNSFGSSIQTVGIVQIQVSVTGMILTVGISIGFLLYRDAIYRFDQYSLR